MEDVTDQDDQDLRGLGPELRTIAVEIARETAALALAVRDRVVGDRSVADMTTKSSATDVVTAGDRECEALVRERLAVLRPDDAVLGEEEGGATSARPGQVRWVVDPIDGTVNYTHGLPWFSVSLGAEIDGRAVAGAVVEPVSGRVWSAAAGHGATLDDRPLRASALDRVEIAVVGTGLAYDPERRARQAALVARVAGSIGDVRRQGCASLDLCSVAAGWVDGFYEHGLKPWDWSAGALIAEEAGAVVRRPVTDASPDAPDDGWGPEATFAAGPALAGPLAELLRSAGAREV
jgi:myo-inositol-1(or 4)-monophosphatase